MDFIKENSADIVNPLFIARGYLDVFKTSEILSDKQKDEIETIDKNLSKIDKLIQSRIKKVKKG